MNWKIEEKENQNKTNIQIRCSHSNQQSYIRSINIVLLKIDGTSHMSFDVAYLAERETLARITAALSEVGITDQMIYKDIVLNQIQFPTNNKKLIGWFLLGLSRLQEDIRELFRYLTATYQMEFVAQDAPPIWMSQIKHESSILFTNTKQQSNISRINIHVGYADKIEVTFAYTTNDVCANIISSLCTVSINANMIVNDKWFKELIFTTNDKKLLGQFFRGLSQVQEDIKELFSILIDKYKVEFVDGYRPQIWMVAANLASMTIYVNTRAQPDICKINMSQYNETKVTVICSTDNQCALIIDVLDEFGITRNILKHEVPKHIIFATNDPKFLGLFFSGLSQVQKDIKELFGPLTEKYKVEFVDGYRPPVWVPNSDVLIGMTYTNTNSSINIYQIILYYNEYSGTIHITARYSVNDAAMLSLITNALSNLGITDHMFSSDVNAKKIGLFYTHEKQLILSFLRGLYQVQSDINELIMPICEILKIELDENYRPPMWLIQQSTFEHHITFISTIQQPLIFKIRLSLDLALSNYRAYLYYDPEQINSTPLITEVAKMGVLGVFSDGEDEDEELEVEEEEELEVDEEEDEEEDNSTSNVLRISCDDRLSFWLLLKFLVHNDRDEFKHLTKTFSESLNTPFLLVDEGEFALAVINGQWTEAKNILASGINLENTVSDIFNLKILKAIFSYDQERINNFFQNFEVNPIDNFKCPITNTLMLRPVSIGDTLQDGFRGYEYRNIVHWIKRNGTSPLTRINKTEDDIQNYDDLAQKIEQYVHDSMQNMQCTHDTKKRLKL